MSRSSWTAEGFVFAEALDDSIVLSVSFKVMREYFYGANPVRHLADTTSLAVTYWAFLKDLTAINITSRTVHVP